MSGYLGYSNISEESENLFECYKLISNSISIIKIGQTMLSNTIVKYSSNYISIIQFIRSDFNLSAITIND